MIFTLCVTDAGFHQLTFVKRKRLHRRLKDTWISLADLNQVNALGSAWHRLKLKDVCVQVRNSLDEKDAKDVAKLSSIVECMRTFPEHTRFFISTLDSSISKVFYEASCHRKIIDR